MLTGLAILWRRSTDDRLPWTVLWVLASVFISRVYWLTALGTLRAEQLACLALFVHFLVDLRRKQRGPGFELPQLLVLAMLPLMVLSSLQSSPLSVASLRKTLIYFPYLGGFVALCHFLDSGRKLAAAWDFLIRFGAGIMAVSLASYFLFMAGVNLGTVRVESGVIWLRGSLVNPNIFGAAAGIVLLSTLVSFLFSNTSASRGRRLDLAILAVSAGSLLVSFSRSVWILAVLAAAAVFWRARRERKKWLPAFSAILLAVSFTYLATIVGSKAYNVKLELNPGLRSETTGEFGEAAKDRFINSPSRSFVPTSTPFKQRFRYSFSSMRWRVLVSARALRDWLESPVFGRGTDYLLLSHTAIPQFYLPVTGIVILHDWGAIAFALYLSFLMLTGIRLARRLLRPSSAQALFLAIFVVFLFQTLQSQVSTTLQLGSFWVLAAIFATAAGKAAIPGTLGGARPLRVGFDAKWFFSDTSSCRVMVRSMLGALITQKGDLELFVFLGRRDRRRDFPYHGPGIHPVYVAGRPNLLANLVTMPWQARRLGLDAGIFQYFSPPFGQCRRIVMIHDIIFAEHPEYFSLAERLYFRPMRQLARRAQVICTISKTEKARLLRHGYGEDKNIKVLYPGVSPRFMPRQDIPAQRREEISSRYGLPPRFLLYLGRLNVRKNIVNMLHALALLGDRDIPLVLAGASGRAGKKIDTEIKRLRLEDRVIRPGYIDENDLPVLMALATLFCYVSHDEGFGLPVLEAMASGVAVVVSRKDVLEELCGPAGSYVDPDDPPAIASAIDRLLAEPEFRRRKTELGLAQCRQYSWERSAAQLLALCREHPVAGPMPGE